MNLEMAKKLAFGVPFDPRPDDLQVSQDLLGGMLTLFPHPKWKMPGGITWSENPFGEVNWVAQYHMLRWVDPLRRSFEKTLDAGYLDLWEKIVTSWIRNNPPGRGRASYAWADMVEAGRALTMSFGLPMLAESDSQALDLVVASLGEHGDWLSDPRNIRTGNHALQQHQGLLVLGAVLDRKEWVDTAIERSREMLLSAYDDQGVNEEGAIQYHQVNYSWWGLLQRRIEAVVDEAPVEFARIKKAPNGLVHAMRPDGAYELIGDTEVFHPKARWTPEFEYASSEGKAGRPPVDTLKVFDAGYVFGRSGWGTGVKNFSEESFFSIRFGPQNRIHGHADGMALTLFHNGESVLIDTGKYAYDAKDPLRAYLLSREAHNSVNIPDKEYQTETNVTLRELETSGALSAFAIYDTGYAGVQLMRTIVVDLSNEFIVVVDRVHPATQVKQNWHLAPNFSHRATSAGIFIQSTANSVWLVPGELGTTFQVVKGQEEPFLGWYSPTWRDAVPTRSITFGNSADQDIISTLISFSGESDSPTFKVHTKPDGDLIVFIGRAGKVSLIEITDTAVTKLI